MISITFEQFIMMIKDKKLQLGEFGFDILKMKLDGKLNKFKQKLFKK